MNDPVLNILVIDDDDVSAETVSRALKKVPGKFHVISACDGRDGLEVLRGNTERKLSRPYLILLDLNMPRMNGFEFLEQLRGDDGLRDSVVFVLTTSDADADRTRAYREQIAGYMVKSAIGPQFVRLSSLLQDYAAAVQLPT